eukprot:c2020_g1_i1.p1 GENE.c2020_g1_i1~~c2020_g1_i1.p1  ORF type:complete len:502 (-),score=56.31 c2020_g1_i1:173-1678(-)
MFALRTRALTRVISVTALSPKHYIVLRQSSSLATNNALERLAPTFPPKREGKEIPTEQFVLRWRAEVDQVDRFFMAQFTSVLASLSDCVGGEPTNDIFELASRAAKNSSLSTISSISLKLIELQSECELYTKGFHQELTKWDEIRTTRLATTLMPELLVRSFTHTHTLRRLVEALQASTRLPVTTSEWNSSLGTELVQLRAIIQSTQTNLLSHMVAHRGFHCTKDGIHRPLENTLQAMEQAWIHGIQYCECDVGVTQDGQLVLAHDHTLHRVSLFPQSKNATSPLQTMTFREIVASPLKNGVRPPLLKDVLETASRLGSVHHPSQLVVELKPGFPDISIKLTQMFAGSPHLLQSVAVVMSFDPDVVYSFAKQLSLLRWSMSVHGQTAPASWPAVMLLTCAPGQTESPYEIEFSIANPADIDNVQHLLVRGDAKLDGLYLQHEPELISTHSDVLKRLCEQCSAVGVWGALPDDATTMQKLVDSSVAFVNTDLPHSFTGPAPV